MKPQPFLKWVGGKRKLVPFLRELLPKSYGRYFEPFVGGGALFFDIVPARASLSDANVTLINTYKAVRDDVDGVIRILRQYRNDRDMYNRVRAHNFNVGTPQQRAAEFIYVNRVCYNGVHRVNSSGRFNVPFGRYENPKICDRKVLRAASRALQNAKLHARGFDAVLEHAKEGDVVYFDPPYVPKNNTTANFVHFSKDGFSDRDQVRLRDVALKLKRRGVHVMLSNSDMPFVRELYAGKRWTIHEVQMARAINSAPDKRGKVTELVIT